MSDSGLNVGFIDMSPDGRRWKIFKALGSSGIQTSQVIFPCRPIHREIEEYYVFGEPIRLWEKVMRSRLARIYHLQLGLVYYLLTKFALHLLKGTDLIHCQSSPDFIAANAVASSSRPIAAEIYDVASLYDDPVFWFTGSPTLKAKLLERVLRWEEKACTESDLTVFTTKQMLRHAEERYGRMSKPIVVPNAVNDTHINQGRKALKRGRISEGSKRCGVYLGAIESSKRRGGHRMIVKDLRAIADGLDCNIDIYGTSADMASVISELGDSDRFHVRPLMHYDELFDVLPRYDFGIAILARKNERLLNAALPNKLFEYAAAGLPSIVSPYAPLVEFVKDFKAGVVWQPGEPVPEPGGRVAFNEYFSMEYHVRKLVDGYRGIVQHEQSS